MSSNTVTQSVNKHLLSTWYRPGFADAEDTAVNKKTKSLLQGEQKPEKAVNNTQGVSAVRRAQVEGGKAETRAILL